MDGFKVIHAILRQLEEDMDLERVRLDRIDSDALAVSERRWAGYIEMLADSGYIKGVRIVESVTGEIRCDCSGMKITLRGLEYLQENNFMRKAQRVLKGVKDMTPGL